MKSLKLLIGVFAVGLLVSSQAQAMQELKTGVFLVDNTRFQASIVRDKFTGNYNANLLHLAQADVLIAEVYRGAHPTIKEGLETMGARAFDYYKNVFGSDDLAAEKIKKMVMGRAVPEKVGDYIQIGIRFYLPGFENMPEAIFVLVLEKITAAWEHHFWRIIQPQEGGGPEAKEALFRSDFPDRALGRRMVGGITSEMSEDAAKAGYSKAARRELTKPITNRISELQSQAVALELAIQL